MKIGVDYYPEHWDKALWEEDASLMKKTGVSVVRLAEFAWSRLEPREGEFDFSWLDEVIELFSSRILRLCFALLQTVPLFGCMKNIRTQCRRDVTEGKSQ